jgi:hypothetical protein
MAEVEKINMPQLIWPWNPSFQSDARQTNVKSSSSLNTTQPDAGEFSFNDYIPTTLSNLVKNNDRLSASNGSILDTPAKIPWYNFPARFSAQFEGFAEGLQSTLTKVIILVAIVGVVAIFLLSYVQAKGISIAK